MHKAQKKIWDSRNYRFPFYNAIMLSMLGNLFRKPG